MTLPVNLHGVEHKPDAFGLKGLRLYVLISAYSFQCMVRHCVNRSLCNWVAFVALTRPGFIQLTQCVLTLKSNRTTSCPLEAVEEYEWAILK